MLSWKARRRGDRRCAPACGRGCTQAEYEHATREAKKLCQLLNKTVGGVWRPRVWENMGWHWSAHQGDWKIHPFKNGGSYTAFLGPKKTGGIWAESGRTPGAAIRNTRKVAEELTREYASLLGMTLSTTPKEK